MAPAPRSPAAGDHIFTCQHIPSRWHWMGINPPQRLVRSDGSAFYLRFIRLCPSCHERQERGEKVQTRERIL